MTLLSAKQELAILLNIDYSDIANNGLWQDSDLTTLIQGAVLRAWDYKPWPFAKKSKTMTTITNPGYYDYPPDLMIGSVYLIKVAGKEFKKVDIQNYLKWFEDNPTAVDKFFAETESFLFVNQNAYNVGDQMDVYGKKNAPTLVNPTDLLPFSPVSDTQQYSGNEAVVQLAFGLAYRSKKLNDTDKAELIEKEAYRTLEMVWKPFGDNTSLLQRENRPMFNVPNFFGVAGSIPGPSNYFGNFNLPQ